MDTIAEPRRYNYVVFPCITTSSYNSSFCFEMRNDLGQLVMIDHSTNSNC